MRPLGDERGLALLLVLVVIVLTVGTVYAFARSSLLSVLAEQRRADRVRAELMARSAVAIAVRALRDDRAGGDDGPTAGLETAQDPWYLLGEYVLEVPGDGDLHIRVRDAGNRINLNALVDEEGLPREDSAAFLADALEHIIAHMPGRTEDKRYQPAELADGILDWIDSDDQTRLGDDELDAYSRQHAGRPPSRPLFALSELSGVPGVDEALLAALAEYFTTQPPFPDVADSGVNLNTAPPHVLALIYQGTSGDKRLLGEDGVFAILRARREDRIFCPGSREEPCVSYESEIGRVGETVFPPLRFRSDVFEVRVEARFSESRACVTTVVDRSNAQELVTLSYRIAC